MPGIAPLVFPAVMIVASLVALVLLRRSQKKVAREIAQYDAEIARTTVRIRELEAELKREVVAEMERMRREMLLRIPSMKSANTHEWLERWKR